MEQNKFRIECLKQIGNNYSYSFAVFSNNAWTYELTKLGKGGFSVLSTIIVGLDYIYDKHSPNAIMFSAIDDSDTRKRLYESYCNKFCEKHNLKLSNRGNEKTIFYLMFKENLNDVEKEEVMQSVQKIVEEGK